MDTGVLHTVPQNDDHDPFGTIPGLAELRAEQSGDPGIRVAVLDGPVDLGHPCFEGASLREVPTMVSASPTTGRMSQHGTHITSLLFGQPGSAVSGLVPRCTGLVVPIFSDAENGHLPQLDLARAIEAALGAGADIINISGGQRSVSGEPDPILERVLRTCATENVLVVAAMGNDGCECLHVPAAVATVLAVGALGRDGMLLASSNWGHGYHGHGVLAPGEALLGASPGGATRRLSGTSFATPIVAGVAALLLGVQRAHGSEGDPAAIGRLIAHTATPLSAPREDAEPGAPGALDVAAAYRALGGHLDSGDGPYATSATAPHLGPSASSVERRPAGVLAAGLELGDDGPAPATARTDPQPATDPTDPPPVTDPTDTATRSPSPSAEPNETGETAVHETFDTAETATPPPTPQPPTADSLAVQPPSVDAPAVSASAEGGIAPACAGQQPVRPSGECGCGGVAASEGAPSSPAGGVALSAPSYVYALGTIGFDFLTEARRDTFRQLMPDVVHTQSGTPVSIAPNPYDVFQLTDYLDGRPSESTKLTWTLTLDLTPIYALEAELAYPEDVYSVFRHALASQALPEDDPEHVAKVSIPGALTGRVVQLFSGQTVPVVRVQPRGLYEWNVRALIDDVIDALKQRGDEFDEQRLRRLVRIFLDKVYFECRNLGVAPADRALNFAATNAFQFASGIAQGLLSGEIVPSASNSLYSLDSIRVSRSPYCRVDSDCWDVLITWFDPENERRAKSIYQFTIDVSDELPVSLAPAHQYLAT